MKKIKIVYLILGLGIGLILSNILYTNFPVKEYIELSDADIIKRAEELGYVSIKDKISTETKTTDQNEDKFDKVKESNDETKEDSDDGFIELEIVEGDTLKDISKKLLELDLIDDEEEFISTVEEKNMDKRFAYGIFKIPIDSSYSQIIELLTK